MPRSKRIPRSVAIEKWTWQQAEQALGKNVHNRRLITREVEKYARAMTTGLWGDCTVTIAYDWDGNLIDGQHRLHAQVMTKTDQEWVVYRGLPPTAQKHIDTGIVRSAPNKLQLEGYPNAIILSGVARWAFLLEQGQANNSRFKPSIEEIQDMVERNPDLEHSAVMGAYARHGFVLLNPTPIGAAHWWIARYNGHGEADKFVDRFVHMNREDEDGSAVVALMRRMKTVRKKKNYLPTQVQIAMVLKAWNYDVEGRHVHSIMASSRKGDLLIPEVAIRSIPQDVPDLDESSIVVS